MQELCFSEALLHKGRLQRLRWDTVAYGAAARAGGARALNAELPFGWVSWLGGLEKGISRVCRFFFLKVLTLLCVVCFGFVVVFRESFCRICSGRRIL